jgi:predicted ABC-type ATPase
MARRPDQPPPAEEAASEQAAVGYRPVPDRRPAGDQAELADRTAPWSRESLRQRLGRLPDWHPSSPTQADSHGGRPERDLEDEPPVRPEPLTDAVHEDRVRHIRAELAEARTCGLATDARYVDSADNRWTTERQLLHRDLVDDLYTAAAEVPCDRRAIMAGGLGGAGKSTVLDRHADVDRSQYMTVNPDGIKEAMASRGLIPELEGLSPMEASDLVHAESSYIAKRLARRAMDDGKNIIWDITMSGTSATEERLDNLDRAGYSTRGVFVEIDLAEAVRRADSRHRQGHEDYRAGIGLGGRYVPPEVIEAQADPEYGCVNRRTFEQVKQRFTDWAIYDNSVTGRDPVLMEAGHGGKREEER